VNCDPRDGHLKKCPLSGSLRYNRIYLKENGECIMGYTEAQIKRLEENPNVKRVSEMNISFTQSFKLAAVKAYKAGKTPKEIFLEAGFDVNMFNSDRPKESLKRWRKTYAAYGEEALLEERRGKGSTGRPTSKELSVEEKLRRAEVKIKLLEVENEFLKKLKALERQAKQDKR
jgi:transposase